LIFHPASATAARPEAPGISTARLEVAAGSGRKVQLDEEESPSKS
jgi:hypothetical protein